MTSPFARLSFVASALALAALAALALAPGAEAQPPPATPPAPAPSNCQYTIDNNIPFQWVDISGNGTGMANWVSDTETEWLTFDPPLYGYVCGIYGDNFLLSSKGHFCLAMGQNWAAVPGCGWCCDAPGPIPSLDWARPGIWGFYADLDPSLCPGGSGATCVYHKVFGTAPNRWFLFQFEDIPYYGSSGQTNSFQMRLYESDGCIETHYLNTVAASTSWPRNTAGYNGDGSTARGWQYDYAANGMALSSTAWRACPENGLPPMCTPMKQVIAPGDTATLTAQLGVTPYTWSVSPSAGVSAPSWTGATVTPTFSASGTYQLTVTGANQAASTCTVRVVLPQCGYTIRTTDTDPDLFQWDELNPAKGGSGEPMPWMWSDSSYAVTPDPPMAFTLCGDTFSTFRLASGGYICMDTSGADTGTVAAWWDAGMKQCGAPWSQTMLPSADEWVPRPAVFGLWTYLTPDMCPNFDSSNCLFYEVRGDAPDRVLIYEFDEVPLGWSSSLETFQIKLFEASGCVEAHYLKTADSPDFPYYPAVGGYQDVEGSAGYVDFFEDAFTTWEKGEYAWRACPFGASPDSYLFNEDQAAQDFDVTENDNGAGQAYSVVSWTEPEKGTLVRLAGPGDFSFQPHPDANGDDSFTYVIRNSAGTMESEAKVSITINPVNDPPTFDGGVPFVITTPAEGPRTLPGWASAVKAGPDAATDESMQAIAFTLSSIQQGGIFSAPPTLQRSLGANDPNPMVPPTAGSHGVLRFAPSGQTGRATVCFQAVDDGGTETVTNGWGETATGVDVGDERCLDILENAPPVAYFRPSNPEPAVGDAVTFDPCPGPAPHCTFDPDGQVANRLWEFGDGATSAEEAPRHTFATAGEFVVRLSVWDEHGTRASFERTLHAVWRASASVQEEAVLAAAPRADAGEDRVVLERLQVRLAGLQSGGSPETAFAWTQQAGPTVILEGADTPNPTFTAPALPGTDPVDLLFALRVKDGGLESDPAYVTVRVVSANTAPVAAPVPVPVAVPGSTVQLEAKSHDADGDALTYLWEQVPEPGTPRVSLDGATSAKPSFRAPSEPGLLRFRLTVSDGRTAAVDHVSVEVRAAAAAEPEPESEEPAPAPVQVLRGPAVPARADMLPILLGAVAFTLLAGLVAFLVLRRLR